MYSIDDIIGAIHQNGKRVKNKKHPNGLQAVTEDEISGIEITLTPLPHDLRKLLEETAHYRYPGNILLSPYGGANSKFVDTANNLYEEGLPKDWVPFCDTGNYVFCIFKKNMSVRAWELGENAWTVIGDSDEIEQWDSLASWAAAEWVDMSSSS